TVFGGGPLATQGERQVAEQRGQRRAELVRGFGGEPLLAAVGLVEPEEQAVEGVAECGDLVAGVGDGELAVGVLGHFGGGGGHPSDRPERPLTEPPSGGGGGDPDRQRAA